MEKWKEDVLIHYGVLGMKWGIRRYQPYSVHPRSSGKGGREIGEASRKGNRLDGFVSSIEAVRRQAFEEENNIRDVMNAEIDKQLKKHGFKSYDDAWNKAVDQNEDLDSGKLKYEKSIHRIINDVENMCLLKYKDKFDNIESLLKEKEIELSEDYINYIMSSKKLGHIKFEDLYNPNKQGWSYDIDLLISRADDSNNFVVDFGDRAISRR